MNIGYKDSPLGKIPSDWVIEKLESLVVIESGVSPSQYEFHENGKNMFYKVNQLNDFEKKMGESPYRFESNLRNNIPANSIAFPKRGASIFTNKVRILSYPAMVDTNIMCLIPKKEINYEFLYYFILDFGLSKIADTSSIPQINNKHIYPIKIALPPLPEQQKIAEILSTVDAKIEVIDQQITETQALKKGFMQRLLTKGIGHTEFKDSALGEIPKSWEVVNVGNVCKLKGGFAFKSSDACEQGIRWVKIANVGVNRIKWDDESFLPYGFDLKHKDFLLKEGDMVIAMTRPILNGKLKIAIVSKKDADSLLNQRVGSIVHENTINRDFVYQFFNSTSFITAMEKELMGTDPPNISSSMFEGLNIVLPPLLEQMKIAEILSSVDSKLEVLFEKKSHYQELKQGLMQQLLTGKLRVFQLPNKNETSVC